MVSFNLMMTRCFGYSVPSASLVPIMDMLNHSDRENTTHYIVNMKLEEGQSKEENKGCKYRLKNKKLNLELLGFDRNEPKV